MGKPREYAQTVQLSSATWYKIIGAIFAVMLIAGGYAIRMESRMTRAEVRHEQLLKATSDNQKSIMQVLDKLANGYHKPDGENL